jgi:hypothetical protein
MQRLTGGRFVQWAFAVVAIVVGLALIPARAGVVVQIDKSSPRMAVSVDGTQHPDRDFGLVTDAAVFTVR